MKFDEMIDRLFNFDHFNGSDKLKHELSEGSIYEFQVDIAIQQGERDLVNVSIDFINNNNLGVQATYSLIRKNKYRKQVSQDLEDLLKMLVIINKKCSNKDMTREILHKIDDINKRRSGIAS